MSATVISSLLLSLFICLEACWNLYLCLGPSRGSEPDRELLEAWEPFLRELFIRSLFLAATCNIRDSYKRTRHEEGHKPTSLRHILFL